MTSSFVAASIGAEHLAVEGGREGRREVHRRRKDAEDRKDRPAAAELHDRDVIGCDAGQDVAAFERDAVHQQQQRRRT